MCVRQHCLSLSTSSLYTPSLSSPESVWVLSLYFLPLRLLHYYLMFICLSQPLILYYYPFLLFLSSLWLNIWGVSLFCCTSTDDQLMTSVARTRMRQWSDLLGEFKAGDLKRREHIIGKWSTHYLSLTTIRCLLQAAWSLMFQQVWSVTCIIEKVESGAYLASGEPFIFFPP